MKKFLAILFAVLMLLLLPACGLDGHAGDGTKTSVSPGSNPETPQSSGPVQMPEGDIRLLCDDSSSFSNHFSTDGGFYYFTELEPIGSELYGMHLMYIDYATKKEVYLCSDPGCQHNTEACSSVFSMKEFGIDSLLFVHGGWLYVVNREFDQDGSAAIDMTGEGAGQSPESKPVVLYRMGLDGSSRQRVFTFPANAAVEKIVFSDGADLWFVTKTLEFERDGSANYTSSTNRTLSKLSLSQNKFVSEIPLEFGDNMHHKIIGGSGNQFVLLGVAYPQGMSEKEIMKLSDAEWREIYKNSSTVCSTLDATSKQIKEVYQRSNSLLSLNCVVKEGYLYASDAENSGILKIDLNTGESSTLATLPQNYIYYALDDALCCWDTGASLDNSLYFVDLITGSVKQGTLTNKRLGWKLDILADAGDQVLVIYDYEATPHGDGSYEITNYQYGLINKSDLYNSVDKFEPIAMAGRESS